MFNKVNVVTIFKGSWVGKVYDEHVDYNCNGAINSGKMKGAGISIFAGEQQLEQFYCTCASKIA